MVDYEAQQKPVQLLLDSNFLFTLCHV